MPRNIVEEQLTSLKTHPHVRKAQKVSNRLIKVAYAPQNSLESQYKIKIELPLNYPDEPPTVKFMDPIEHLNICPQSGLVHQPLLMEEWSPYLSLYIIIDILDTLMAEPERDPKYCVNYNSSTISQIKKKNRKQSQQSNSNRPQYSRKITRSISRMEQFPAIVHQAFADEEAFDIEVNQPVRPRRGLKRWKSFRCEKPFDYVSLETSTQEEQQKKVEKVNAHKLSLICEEVQQNSKAFELSGENSPKASLIYPNPHQRRREAVYLNEANAYEQKQPLFRTSRSPPTHRKLERKASNVYSPMNRMPALRRMTSIVDEDIQSNRTGPKTQMSPSGRLNDLKSTTFFDNSSHQLSHINRLLSVFTKEYQQLLDRRKMTSNQKLAGLIDNKVKQQLDMIVQLEELSSQLKKQMMEKVKKDSNR